MKTSLRSRHQTTQSVDEIARGILDPEMWSTFKGWGPLPGIARAAFDRPSQGVVGTRVRAFDTRGQSHTETITAWDLPNRIEIKLHEFDRPLSLLATEFIERWVFRDLGEGRLEITRTMDLTPRSWLTWPALQPIKWMMNRAIERHMRETLAG